MSRDSNLDPTSLSEADRSEPGAEPEPACRPWGPWTTICGTTACVGLVLLVQFGMLRIAIRADPQANVEKLVSTGSFLAVSTLAGVPFALGSVWMLVAFRRCSVKWYLALRWPEARPAWISAGVLVLLLAGTDGLSYLLGRPIVPRWMVDVYRTAGSLPLLVLAIVVGAPLVEETLFRGFLFRGIADSQFGPRTAVALSALFWACLHLQYDAFGIGQVLVIGIYLGIVRLVTRSVPLTMLLHALGNAVATVEVAVKVQFFS